jgi:arginine/ornithine transport system substrate-binding protein
MRQADRLTAMRNILAAFAVAVLLPVLPARADKLTFGNEGTYPPFSVIDPSGRLTGFEPELAREMCKRMNAECDIVAMDFKALIPSLLAGKLDGVVSQITPTPDRVGHMLFSVVIIQNLYSFVVPADSHYTFTKEGLKGVRMGLVNGGATSKYIMNTFGDSIVPVWYDNMVQIKLELLNGRVDMTFGARINWRLDLLDTPDGKGWKMPDEAFWLGDPNLPEDQRGLSWIVRPGNEALLARMNTALTSMIADCSYTRLREQFIKFSILPAEAHCLKPSG